VAPDPVCSVRKSPALPSGASEKSCASSAVFSGCRISYVVYVPSFENLPIPSFVPPALASVDQHEDWLEFVHLRVRNASTNPVTPPSAAEE
jgi:hypothetical protein